SRARKGGRARLPAARRGAPPDRPRGGGPVRGAGKQYLVSVRPEGEGLVMEQLRYANEVRSIAEVPIPKLELKKQELELAAQLVEQGASDHFRPAGYEDNVRKR